MKMRMILFLIVALGALTLAGCGGEPPKPVVDPNNVSSAWPAFMEAIPEDPGFFLASATATSRDAEMAVSKAELDAQGKLSVRVAAVIDEKMQTISEEVGLGDDAQFRTKTERATVRSASQVLKGLRIREKKYIREGNGFRAFVLVEATRALADEALFGAVAKDEELRTRFMASKIFKELDSRFN